MALRQLLRNHIFAALAAKVRQRRIRGPFLTIAARVGALANAELTITPYTTTAANDRLALSTHPRPLPVAFIAPLAKSKSLSFALSQRAVTPDLAPLPCLHSVDLAFHPPVPYRFLFPRRADASRPRPPDLKPDTTSPTPSGASAFPPSVDRQTTPLADRLRWLLMPPLRELLSDPRLGLPHRPYDYQIQGIAWLWRTATYAALLADEMGLGKTMQAIIAARLLWRENLIQRILIICPKTLISTWLQELRLWWPTVMDYTYVCTEDTRWFLRLATSRIVVKIINYERLAREADWIVHDSRTGSHDLIIIDEAQRIKNPDSKTAKAVKALKAPRRWALTGTPLETRIGDVRSIFGFIKPGVLTRDDPEHVRRNIQPYMLRRRLEEVLPQLPKVDARDVEVDLTDKQRAAYELAEMEGVVRLNELGDTITIRHVFALIQKLIQLCNFEPASGESAKLMRLIEDLEEIVSSGRKVLIFSQFVAKPFGLESLKERLSHLAGTVALHGDVSEAERSAAVEAFTTDPDVQIMLLQYRVGGVGLNLQAANYVYLFERWWNPAVEDQAIKRAHRIGQRNRVFVRRFFARDTIEERILRKLEERRRLFARVIDKTQPHKALGLTEDEIFALFRDLKARPKDFGRSRGSQRGRH